MESSVASPAFVDTKGDGWSDRYTRSPLIASPGSLGMTVGTGLPSLVRTMERHEGTEEAILPAGQPLVLAVAAASRDTRPNAAAVSVFLIPPTSVVVLHPGSWHDACHGVSDPSPYYWYAATQNDRSSGWCPLDGGQVLIEAPASAWASHV